MPRAKTLAEAFAGRYTVSPEGCWLWDGALAGKGYGHMTNKGKNHKAHRVSWSLRNGPIPDGAMILHHCDTPRCCNPDHLYLGDGKQNARDMHARGRAVNQTAPEKMAHGERNGQAKLTDAAAKAIKSDKRKLRIIASDYGISEGQISLIRRGLAWAHL